MLTEQEKMFVERQIAKKKCNFCLKQEHCSLRMYFNSEGCSAFVQDFPYDIESDYEDAAEFAERVAAKLTLEEPCPLPGNADLDDCPYVTEDDGSAFSCRWCRLKRARIAVEEEMDE